MTSALVESEYDPKADSWVECPTNRGEELTETEMDSSTAEVTFSVAVPETVPTVAVMTVDHCDSD